jgi:LEA14-like dessication related protein
MKITIPKTLAITISVSMKITIPKTLAITISVSTLLLVGCTGVGKRLEPPRISLANIQVQEFTGFETVFQIKLRVFNSNDVDLNVKGFRSRYIHQSSTL